MDHKLRYILHITLFRIFNRPDVAINTFVNNWLSRWSFCSEYSRYCLSQTIRAKELTLWEIDHPPQCVTCHVSHFMCQVSHIRFRVSGIWFRVSGVTCQVSRVTSQLSDVTCQVSCVRCQVSHLKIKINYNVLELVAERSRINVAYPSSFQSNQLIIIWVKWTRMDIMQNSVTLFQHRSLNTPILKQAWSKLKICSALFCL